MPYRLMPARAGRVVRAAAVAVALATVLVSPDAFAQKLLAPLGEFATALKGPDCAAAGGHAATPDVAERACTR